jgi:N-acyl-D-aspartate/D-glutamate deacylase
MDWLSQRNFDMDIGAQLPHAALRVYVMGERGARRDPATPEDNRAMAALAGDAVRAGALGFSTSRTLNHRTSTGDFTPTLKAGEDELTAIAGAMHKVGRSVLQFVLDQGSIEEDLPMMLRVAEKPSARFRFRLRRPTRRRDVGARRWTPSMKLPPGVWRSPRRSPRARSGCCSGLNCRATRSRPIRATGRSQSCRWRSAWPACAKQRCAPPS